CRRSARGGGRRSLRRARRGSRARASPPAAAWARRAKGRRRGAVRPSWRGG
ncbi:MAG: hypothetical protein AVDCRST_MAG39-85, partial [uncultured Sphingomonadaceae bacterium]